MPVPPVKSTAAWLSAHDAAKLLDVTPDYIAKLGRSKRIRSKRLGPNRNAYSKADVAKFAAQRKPRKKPRKRSRKPGSNGAAGKPGSNGAIDTDRWVDVAEAARITGLTKGGVNWAAKQGRIPTVNMDGHPRRYLYSADACENYKRTNNGPKAQTSKSDPATRMAPKRAQTAIQKARWVFDGIAMGAITSESEALELLRGILYED